MKSTHRFDYARLGDSLVERGLLDRETLQHVLQQCSNSHVLMPDVLVTENFVSDWEVSRVCCELFSLPFLSVDIYPPSPEALDGVDPAYLRRFSLVPLDRFGDLLTVAMPGMVASEVLDGLRTGAATRILPVVGSVLSNRLWLEEHLPDENEDLPGALPDLSLDDDAGWAGIFDAGDAAVQLGLQDDGEPLVLPDAEDDGAGTAAKDVTADFDENSITLDFDEE